MQALIHTALQQNYDVRIAVARILEAQAQLGISRSFLFPQLDGNGTITRDRISDERFLAAPSGKNEGNTFLLGLSLFYEIDLWGRLRRETEAARAELLSTEWGRRAVLVTLVADVARAYFELREFDLDLHLVPTHPDRAGGLGFLEQALFAFSPIILAMSAVITSHWAHQIPTTRLPQNLATEPPGITHTVFQLGPSDGDGIIVAATGVMAAFFVLAPSGAVRALEKSPLA